MEAARDDTNRWAAMTGGGYKLVRAREVKEGAGATVKRALPARALGYLDPFILLDELFVLEGAGFPDHDHGEALEIAAGDEPVRFALLTGEKIGEPIDLLNGFVK